VPQPADYLRVWADICSVASGRATQKLRAVDRFCHDANPKFAECVHAEPQREQKQIAFAMAEAIRVEDRAFLRRASDCVLCADASSSRNVISFVATCAADVVVQVREGLIGIADETGFDVSAGPPGVSAGGPSVDVVDASRSKKSDKAKEQMMNCIRTFHSEGAVDKATPGRFNLRDFDHHRSITRALIFDGAADAQLTGRKLAADPQCFPNTREVVRDRAHAVRTNVRAPLTSDPELKRIRHELLNKPDSLSKLVQYHPRARNQHLACQIAVLKVDGVQGGGLKGVIKHFSFANQRFESEETPARRIACTLLSSILFF